MPTINVSDEFMRYVVKLRLELMKKSERNVSLKDTVEEALKFVHEREDEFLESK